MQLNVQLDYSRKLLKLTLKFALKCSYVFRFNKPSSGSLLLVFAKAIIIKIYILTTQPSEHNYDTPSPADLLSKPQNVSTKDLLQDEQLYNTKVTL